MGFFDELKQAGNSILEELQSDVADALEMPELAPKQAQPQQEPTPQASAPHSAPTPAPAPEPDSSAGLYNPQLEKLIDLALADGELTEKEKQVLFKKAESFGIDLDEFEMVLDARLYKRGLQPTAPAASAPQSKKFKDVKKCPACGAMIQSFTTRCPECGYEFRNLEANGGIQRLFEMLNEVETSSREDADTLLGGLGRVYSDLFAQSFGGNKNTRRKKTIIQNFPIPNTKEDILEFLALALPLAKRPGFFEQDMEKQEMYPVWRAKCEQVIIKARFSMKDDPKTLAQINEYGKQIGIK